MQAQNSQAAGNEGPAVGYELRHVQSSPPYPANYHHHPDEDQEFSLEVQHGETIVVPPKNPTPESYSFLSRINSMRSLLSLLALSSTFCILFCLFIYLVLIRDNVESPGVMWDASKTNYVVGVLSMLSAIITDATLKAFLAAIRPALASRRTGMSWASWTAQGASGWASVLQVAAANWFLNFWCLFRLALPLLSLAMGSIVKFQADFGYYFIASAKALAVYAGLVPPSDLRVLDIIAPADLAMFFGAFAVGLLTNTMFAVPWTMDGCGADCRSFLLPGSISLARQVAPQLNMSIYSTDLLANSSTIRIANATGMIVKYDTPAPESLNFNVTECIYTGAQIDNGLQVCFRQDGRSLVVGWSACPKALLDQHLCNAESPPAWRSAPILSGTRMSLYSIATTASYDRSTQAILDIHLLRTPSQLPVSATDYTNIFQTALIPSASAKPTDTYNIYNLMYFITWMHRTYFKTFPDDQNSPVAMLQNMLAVPVQFFVTAQIYANYSAAERGVQALYQFPLPDNMITEARGGQASSRLVILSWAGWLFIAVDVVVHFVVIVCVGCLLLKGRIYEGQSGIAEVDGIKAAERAIVLFVEGKGWKDSLRRVAFWRKKIVRDAESQSGEDSKMTAGKELTLKEYILEDRVDSKGGLSTWAWARKTRNVRIKEN